MKTYHYQITALHGGSRINSQGVFKAGSRLTKMSSEVSVISHVCNQMGYKRFLSMPFKALHVMCWSTDGGVVVPNGDNCGVLE